MPTLDRQNIREANALLAMHLQALQTRGMKTTWLRPGIRLTHSPAGAPGSALPRTETNADRAARLEALASEAESHPDAAALGTLRGIFVPGCGTPEARLVIVGEAPGAEEERRRMPFVGPAGELLDKSLGAMGLRREDVYITNVVKWRPKTGSGEDQGSGNRKPSAAEIAVCLPMLEQELAIIRPEIILALGASAVAALTGNTEIRITRARGSLLDFRGIPMMPTFHPSYLLRQDEAEAMRREKRLFWEDLLVVMEQLHLPISERQRSFFLPKPSP